MWVRSPVYSSGERTSISGLPKWARTSSLNARIGVSLRSHDRVFGRLTTGGAVVRSRPSAAHLSRPPSSRRTSSWPNRVNTHSA